MKRDAFTLPLIRDELIIDNFAGGGGASTGIEAAFGRPVDVAINHDPQALAMHAANHPHTAHYCESVWDINPREVTRNQPVGLVWLSPDCKHFSKAKGGKPVEKKIRGLAWVALRWAATTRPRVIMLENVEEFVTWGPIGQDGRPCPRRKGREFGAFINALRRQGYAVEWRQLRASDYGAPTTRRRLFLVARRDGLPIRWPDPTHGHPGSRAVRAGKLQPWRTAAECIDWSIPCPSIFERTRPLADATCRRIARGIMRYVIESAEPFIVPAGRATVAPVFTEHANASSPRCWAPDEPLRTICAQTKGGHHALIAPTLIQTGYGERAGQAPRAPGLDKPLGTIVAGGQKHALVAAFMAKHYSGVTGHELHGEPLHTITSQDHNAIVTADLGEGTENHAQDVRAFLLKYYGTDQDPRLAEPLHTVTSRDRFGLVTVAGHDYAITDIGMRMLTPRELFTAQGFPDDYLIGDRPDDGLDLTKTAQVRMVGNSVCPPLARAIVEANFAHESAWKQTA
ncbi:MAG: DNA cytosine methyltransferase [Rhodocyclaceae bacterium]|nr:DNA cytosine methyltransferase [Rhodocyclaceae bacterium]